MSELAKQLHRDIMNLPHRFDAAYEDSRRVAYACGHKDARHAAAELSLTIADALDEAERLKAENARLRAIAIAVRTESHEVLSLMVDALTPEQPHE